LKKRFSPKESKEEDLSRRSNWRIFSKRWKLRASTEIEEPTQRGFKALKREPAPIQEAEEKPFALDEFEMALKRGVEDEIPRGEPPQKKLFNLFP
jgi:hypothetical protein